MKARVTQYGSERLGLPFGMVIEFNEFNLWKEHGVLRDVVIKSNKEYPELAYTVIDNATIYPYCQYIEGGFRQPAFILIEENEND